MRARHYAKLKNRGPAVSMDGFRSEDGLSLGLFFFFPFFLLLFFARVDAGACAAVVRSVTRAAILHERAR